MSVGGSATGQVLLDGADIYDPDVSVDTAEAASRHGVPEADTVSDQVDL